MPPASRCAQVEAIRQTGDCVQLNESLCIGCNLCAVACPFGAIQSGGSRPVAMANSYDTYIPCSIRSSNPSTSAGLRCFGEDLLSWEPGVRSIAVKCDLCEFRAEGPACVSACPSQSLSMVNDTACANAARDRRLQAANAHPQGAPHSRPLLARPRLARPPRLRLFHPTLQSLRDPADVVPLVMGTLVLFLLGAAAGLLLQKLPALANPLNSGFALLGSLSGLVAAIQTFAQGAPIDGQLWLLGTVHLDTLSALMLLVISTVGVAVALYSFAYIREYQGKGDVAIGALMNLFLFAMVGMVLADNALGFLLCYELVTLTTYWLVKTNPEAAKQSRLYLVMNHIGMALVLVAFWLLCRDSGSLEFAALREHHLAGGLASLVFLLSFCGFGLRAGFVPLHGWLPVAEPVAPSHISALMSGVMVKLGLFGILRVSIDFLGASQLWWGYVVLIFGACSAVLGVLFALAEHDLKRLLAYHTVENIGIILMGMGIGVIGIANQQPALVVLGLLGALYHLLNHAIFKSLLFMGTGSVMFRLHTRDMDKMGGWPN